MNIPTNEESLRELPQATVDTSHEAIDAADRCFDARARSTLIRAGATRLRDSAVEIGWLISLPNYVFAGFLDRAHIRVSKLQYGVVGVNIALVATVDGRSRSMRPLGFGSEGDCLGIDEYLVPKSAEIALLRRAYQRRP